MNVSRQLSREGLAVIELLIMIACLCVIIAVISPAFICPHRRVSRIGCVNNLKQVGLAFRSWGLDNQDRFPTQVSITNGGAMECAATGDVFTVFQVLSNELSTPKILVCPGEKDPKRIAANTFGTALSMNPNSQPFLGNRNVSYFVGLDLETNCPQAFVSGDRNLSLAKVPATAGVLVLSTNSSLTWSDSRHDGCGNVGLVDGSVQTFASPWSPAIPNRLALP